MSLWSKSGKIIVNSSGKVCDSSGCPCSSPTPPTPEKNTVCLIRYSLGSRLKGSMVVAGQGEYLEGYTGSEDCSFTYTEPIFDGRYTLEQAVARIYELSGETIEQSLLQCGNGFVLALDEAVDCWPDQPDTGWGHRYCAVADVMMIVSGPMEDYRSCCYSYTSGCTSPGCVNYFFTFKTAFGVIAYDWQMRQDTYTVDAYTYDYAFDYTGETYISRITSTPNRIQVQYGGMTSSCQDSKAVVCNFPAVACGVDLEDGIFQAKYRATTESSEYTTFFTYSMGFSTAGAQGNDIGYIYRTSTIYYLDSRSDVPLTKWYDGPSDEPDPITVEFHSLDSVRGATWTQFSTQYAEVPPRPEDGTQETVYKYTYDKVILSDPFPVDTYHSSMYNAMFPELLPDNSTSIEPVIYQSCWQAEGLSVETVANTYTNATIVRFDPSAMTIEGTQSYLNFSCMTFSLGTVDSRDSCGYDYQPDYWYDAPGAGSSGMCGFNYSNFIINEHPEIASNYTEYENRVIHVEPTVVAPEGEFEYPIQGGSKWSEIHVYRKSGSTYTGYPTYMDVSGTFTKYITADGTAIKPVVLSFSVSLGTAGSTFALHPNGYPMYDYCKMGQAVLAAASTISGTSSLYEGDIQDLYVGCTVSFSDTEFTGTSTSDGHVIHGGLTAGAYDIYSSPMTCGICTYSVVETSTRSYNPSSWVDYDKDDWGYVNITDNLSKLQLTGATFCASASSAEKVECSNQTADETCTNYIASIYVSGMTDSSGGIPMNASLQDYGSMPCPMYKEDRAPCEIVVNSSGGSQLSLTSTMNMIFQLPEDLQ